MARNEGAPFMSWRRNTFDASVPTGSMEFEPGSFFFSLQFEPCPFSGFPFSVFPQVFAALLTVEVFDTSE
jgi:hypothetical protein